MKKIPMLLMLLILLISGTAFADTTDVARDLINSPMPIREKILIGLLVAFMALVIIVGWKILPKLADHRELKITKEAELANKKLDNDKEAMIIENNAILNKLEKSLAHFEDGILQNRQGINDIKSDIAKLFSVIADHEVFQGKLSEGTLENMLFNDHISAFKRLKSFIRLIAMRKNGKIREQGIKVILEKEENKDMWFAAKEAVHDLRIIDQGYFDSVMEDIDKQIFRY